MSKLFLLTILIFCGLALGFSANGTQIDIIIRNPDFNATSFGVPAGYYFLVEPLKEPGDDEWDFLILKQYTYGEITIIFLLGLIWITLLIYVLKKLFTKEKVFSEFRRGQID